MNRFEEHLKFFDWWMRSYTWREYLYYVVSGICVAAILLCRLTTLAMLGVLGLSWIYSFWVYWCARYRYKNRDRSQTFTRNDIR